MRINKWKRVGEKVLLKDLKEGDLFLEASYGDASIYRLLGDPLETEPGSFEARGVETSSGREVSFLQRDEFLHYGPELYRYIRG